MKSLETTAMTPRVWGVGVLCRAIADALEARFNPIAVRGELSGFTRASSGHCYFTLKDAQGQMRCAMFKRSAQMLGFVPKDGQSVEVFGKLGVYEARGELQLVVESMRSVGQGTWLEQFLQLKAQLEAEGLFNPDRKRPLHAMPRAIGVVTSLGAAALHDVATALQRRVPHIPVVVSPALVQGVEAPASLVQALQAVSSLPDVDVVLLVRGGGSLEDLWSFNDEQLARAIVACRVPVISGVGHETDFTIADFCADLRAPTPTAAAELCATAQADLLQQLQDVQDTMHSLAQRQIDKCAQGLDLAQSRIGRPSQGVSQQNLRLARLHQQMQRCVDSFRQTCQHEVLNKQAQLERALVQTLQTNQQRIHRADLRLGLLDPHLVLKRGFSWLTDAEGQAVTSVMHTQIGQSVHATLADGVVDLTVLSQTPN